MQFHLHITTGVDEDGKVVCVDAHEGIDTEYPWGVSTCIADMMPLEEFMEVFKELITTGHLK